MTAGEPGAFPRRVAPGDSETPLSKKLGIVPGMSVAILDGPTDLAELLAPLPEGAKVRAVRTPVRCDTLIAFVITRRRLAALVETALRRLPEGGTLWIAWPKRSSGRDTDLTDEVVREEILPTGWVDTKVCAIDATWSGLKFVLRKERRTVRR